MSYAQEQSSGDMSRNFVGGTAQTVNDGADARDGQLFLFVSADWAGKDLKPPKVLVKKGVRDPVHLEVMENLLMCSCVIVMCGKQCGPLHLALVAHCREFLWKNRRPRSRAAWWRVAAWWITCRSCGRSTAISSCIAR